MSDLEPSARKPRRRRFAVSVRMLMLLVLVAGATLGWRVNRAQTQRRVVAQAKEVGSYVNYDYEFDGNYQYKGNVSPWAPAWLRGLIGDEYFQEVTTVSFHGAKATDDRLAAVEDLDHLVEFDLRDTRNVTDAGLTHLRRLKSLRIVIITDAPITDAGLAHLAGVPRLQELSLWGTPGITDAGLAHLARMPHLQKLKLHDITDAGLAHLAGLSGLRELDLMFTPITDTGLEHLKGLVQIEKLDLLGARDLTDAGLVWLKGLKNLRTLDLSGTMITDAGLAHLAVLTELQELNLSANLLSDAGLAHLRSLRRLRKLSLIGTRVSDGGIAALTAAIPKLVVSRQTPGFAAVPIQARVLLWQLGKSSKK